MKLVYTPNDTEPRQFRYSRYRFESYGDPVEVPNAVGEALLSGHREGYFQLYKGGKAVEAPVVDKMVGEAPVDKGEEPEVETDEEAAFGPTVDEILKAYSFKALQKLCKKNELSGAGKAASLAERLLAAGVEIEVS